jgi:hypothetical protein
MFVMVTLHSIYSLSFDSHLRGTSFLYPLLLPSYLRTALYNLLTVPLCPAMKPQEVTEALQLSKLKDKVWYVVPSCATTGEGLLEGLAWLSNNVKAPPAPAKK